MPVVPGRFARWLTWAAFIKADIVLIKNLDRRGNLFFVVWRRIAQIHINENGCTMKYLLPYWQSKNLYLHIIYSLVELISDCQSQCCNVCQLHLYSILREVYVNQGLLIIYTCKWPVQGTPLNTTSKYTLPTEGVPPKRNLQTMNTFILFKDRCKTGFRGMSETTMGSISHQDKLGSHISSLSQQLGEKSRHSNFSAKYLHNLHPALAVLPYKRFDWEIFLLNSIYNCLYILEM